MSFWEKILDNISQNKSNISFGASAFLYLFVGVLGYFLFFRLFLLGRIVNKRTSQKKEKKLNKKHNVVATKSSNILNRFFRWLLFLNYKNNVIYSVAHPKSYIVAYLFNILYLLYLIVHLGVLLVGIFLHSFRQLSIQLVYINVYFLLWPICIILFMFMIYDKISE